MEVFEVVGEAFLALFFIAMLVIAFFVAVGGAPEGYQDKDGFHYGKPPKGHDGDEY